MCVALADIMQGRSGFKVLTAGLLRVELAPEEYQLYSEGCGGEGRMRRTGDQHEDRRQATCTTVSCCGGGDAAKRLSDKHSDKDLQLLNCTPSHMDRCRRE